MTHSTSARFLVLAAAITMAACASSGSGPAQSDFPAPCEPQPWSFEDAPVDLEGAELDSPPVLLNVREVQTTLTTAARRVVQEGAPRRRYQSVVLFHFDATGATRNMTLTYSSGEVLADSAAVRVARIMRFSPAVKDGCAVSARASFPIIIQWGE